MDQSSNLLLLAVYIVYSSFAVASITFTICVTSIFKPVREWVSKLHPKLEELIHCPYCLGHYVAFFVSIFVGLYIPYFDYKILSYILTVFVMMGIVSLIHYVMLRTYEPISRYMMFREREKQQK